VQSPECDGAEFYSLPTPSIGHHTLAFQMDGFTELGGDRRGVIEVDSLLAIDSALHIPVSTAAGRIGDISPEERVVSLGV
jgi:hypothetical protein